MSMTDDIEDYRVGPEVPPLHAEIARLKVELAKAQAENQTLRNAQKACEDCDAPTIGEFKQLKSENARLAAQWAVAEAKCKEACGECVPSGGYDYFDEVCGLLRVTRGQRDQALEELARLRAAMEPECLHLETVERETHIECRFCGKVLLP